MPGLAVYNLMAPQQHFHRLRDDSLQGFTLLPSVASKTGQLADPARPHLELPTVAHSWFGKAATDVRFQSSATVPARPDKLPCSVPQRNSNAGQHMGSPCIARCTAIWQPLSKARIPRNARVGVRPSLPADREKSHITRPNHPGPFGEKPTEKPAGGINEKVTL